MCKLIAEINSPPTRLAAHLNSTPEEARGLPQTEQQNPNPILDAAARVVPAPAVADFFPSHPSMDLPAGPSLSPPTMVPEVEMQEGGEHARTTEGASVVLFATTDAAAMASAHVSGVEEHLCEELAAPSVPVGTANNEAGPSTAGGNGRSRR